MKKKWDVIIAGAGPGGALAAQKCAMAGMETLMLEKRKMPRDKVCSGMVMGKWAQDILINEFGPIPDDVLVEPKSLLGYAVHVPATTVRTLDINTPITWRKKLDWWMSSHSRDQGVKVLDESPVISVIQNDSKSINVRYRHNGEIVDVRTQFLIGADGARSMVRSALYPKLKTTYWHCYRQCYDINLELPQKRFNFFSTIETAPFYFCTHDKDGFMLMEGGAPVGQINRTVQQSRQYLIDNHQLNPQISPLWKDACVEPILYKELFSGIFRPALGNCLLIGDAAGLNMPVTGEGLGTSLMSGLEAANAIIGARNKGIAVDSTYLNTIDSILVKFKNIYKFSGRIKASAEKGDPSFLSEALLQSWDYALNIFDNETRD